MGLIKAGTGALGGTLADQWKEFSIVSQCLRSDLLTGTEADQRTFLQYKR